MKFIWEKCFWTRTSCHQEKGEGDEEEKELAIESKLDFSPRGVSCKQTEKEGEEMLRRYFFASICLCCFL